MGEAAAGGGAVEMVKVFLRLRPHHAQSHGGRERGPLELGECEDDALRVLDETTVQTIAPEESQAWKNREAGGKFSFTRVFNKPTSQKELFDATTSGLVDKLVKGCDGLLFAYGVTNAGKTYTVEGSETDPGLIPRALQMVFDRANAARAPGANQPKVEISYLQIYNEQVHDLQAAAEAAAAVAAATADGSIPPFVPVPRLRIKLREDSVEVEGLRATEISSCHEGLEILIQGRELRATHETQCNMTSSRSHSVFVIQLTMPDMAKPARLYIVDLAGSERAKRTKASRIRQREASNINCSLMNLMRCLDTLRLNQKNRKLGKKEKIVPFRESKLTLLFRDCFIGGNCGGVAMIVNASARPEDYDETAHALKYGALVKNVKVARMVTRRASFAKFTSGGRRIPRTQSARVMQSATIGAPRRAGQPIGKLDPMRPPSPPLSAGSQEPQSRDESASVSSDYIEDLDSIISPSEHPIISALVYELADARMRAVNLEAEIRAEVAQEMAERMDEMEATFRKRVEAAKQISDNKSELLLKNLRKRMDRASASEVYTLQDIEALVQNINECEDEMEQMRSLHAADVASLKREVEDLKLAAAASNNAAEVAREAAARANESAAAAAANISSVPDGPVEHRRKSFDRVVVEQVATIERLKEELAEERNLHEKTIRQLESATQLAKDAQYGESSAEHTIAALRHKIDNLKTRLKDSPHLHASGKMLRKMGSSTSKLPMRAAKAIKSRMREETKDGEYEHRGDRPIAIDARDTDENLRFAAASIFRKENGGSNYSSRHNSFRSVDSGSGSFKSESGSFTRGRELVNRVVTKVKSVRNWQSLTHNHGLHKPHSVPHLDPREE